jgi:transcriptional regulator with XRE-family HTH domain
MSALPNRIRELRRARGLTQVELAQRAGVTDGQVSRWETGRRPTMLMTTARRLASALGVTVDDLDLGQPA